LLGEGHLNFLFLSAFCFLVTLGVGFFMIKVAFRLNLLDIPGARSSHRTPTPTMGGVAIVVAFFLSTILARFSSVHWVAPGWLVWFAAGAGLVTVVGIIDDFQRLPVLLRLFLYGVAAGMGIAGGIRLRVIHIPLLGMIEFGIFEIPITVLWVLAVVSFYNFMDGIDGLAAGVGVIVTAFLAYIAWEVGNSDIFILSLLLGSSCLGFTCYNFPPAKMFMGDVGSTFIGYTLAVLALVGNQSEEPGHIPFLVPVLLLGTFLFDTTVTLGRRILRREKWYLSHREHYYQKMTNLGFSHLQIILGEYSLTFLLGISALLYIRAHQALAFPILIIWLLLLIGLTRLIAVLEKRHD
jgi:UDP-GlcNAc:undecaprenyl-phosphate GlcNAc-1-phosphate transferase